MTKKDKNLFQLLEKNRTRQAEKISWSVFSIGEQSQN